MYRTFDTAIHDRFAVEIGRCMPDSGSTLARHRVVCVLDSVNTWVSQ